MQLIKKSFLIIFLLLISVGNFTVKAIEYDYLGGRPANPDPNIPNSQSWFIYDLDKGESVQDSMLVINNLSSEVTVLVYAADGIKSSNGGFALKQFVEPRVEVGSWVKFYPDEIPLVFRSEFEKEENIMTFCSLDLTDKYTDLELQEYTNWCEGKEVVEMTIPAKKQKELTFTFSVPQDLDVGEHTGGILIQEKKVDTVDIGSLQGVALTTRVGIRIYETVPGEIIREMQIGSFTVVKGYDDLDLTRLVIKGEKPDFHSINTKINNIGNVSIDFTETLTITNELGLEEAIIIPDRNFQVLRDDSFTSVYEWESPRFGLFGFESKIEYKDIDGNSKTLTSEKITLWILPIREIIAIVLSLILIFIIIKYYKLRQRKLYGGIGWVNYVVKKGDTIGIISRIHNTTWEIFVATNKIKPPYELRTGQKVLVPNIKKNLTFRKV